MILKEQTLLKKYFFYFLRIVFFCHQRPDRSFHCNGRQFPLCARCTGLAVGYILSIFSLLLFGLMKLWMIALFILPMAIDGTGQLFNKWVSTNRRRFVTGLIGGVGVMYIFYTISYQIYLFGRFIGGNL